MNWSISLALVAWMVEGVALGRGVAWAYALGIPLPTRVELLEQNPRLLSLLRAVPERGRDPAVFHVGSHACVMHLAPGRFGLLFWGLRFGALDRSRSWLRGFGSVATASMRLNDTGSALRLQRCFTLRVAPLLVLATVVSSFRIELTLVGVAPLLLVGIIYAASLGVTLTELQSLESEFRDIEFGG